MSIHEVYDFLYIIGLSLKVPLICTKKFKISRRVAIIISKNDFDMYSSVLLHLNILEVLEHNIYKLFYSNGVLGCTLNPIILYIQMYY
jgi:hypothetical protein